MRKSPIHLFLVVFAFLFSCSGEVNDAKRSGLVGNVKSFKEIRCDPTRSNDKWVAGEPLSNDYRVVHFDKDGNFVESFSMGTNGDTLGRSTCVREDGEMVEEIFFTRLWLNPKESRLYQTSKTVLERVSEDQVNYEVWKGDQRASEGANFYDSKGRLIMQVQVRNSLEETVHYVYEKNLLVENYQENMSGQRTATQLYEYDNFDKRGNWKLMLIYADTERIVPDVAINREIEYY
jgi:hypothetical protein